ncbi:hypothetical protein A2966_04730 [Candidatus Roizmanbacteria bacterium RIFCSPLOWO2_01_FULL_41_22]|uniref:Glycosyltransferase RgtA/B/C/D-like domain-containing protein n=1 Tax=Candidatus Roizmanbacteria bacterium RIFCSPLOWO2_01_FULL_41_22 TaxID=1802067 RepID=A0A1F7JAZ4_9BACT|nr:MAG: hypothetical protein A2966_04730 [Candidatus Roizmanbacteria bacterium RIFCSPLOWO2_01_FULL_41_22]
MTISKFSAKRDLLILLAILIVAFAFRLYKINTPLADLHSWRQVDTAAVARNFNKLGFDLLHPRYDDLSSIESGKENPNGWRMVEFPLYSAAFGLLYRYLPIFPVEIYGRLTTVFFSLVIIAVIYYLTKKEAGRTAASFAAITYAVMPFFVFFSRVVLPETTAVAFAFMAILFLYQTTGAKSKSTPFGYYFLSILSFAVAVLIKPTVIFYGLPLLYLFAQKHQWSIWKKGDVYLYFILTLLPFVLWRLYIKQYPEGIPYNDWLFTSVNTFEGLKKIFFKPAFFRWIFFERLGIGIFGVYLSVFFFLGLVAKTKKYLLHVILLACVIYLFTFQGGNVQHEYYQTIILPPVAIMVGLGVAFLISQGKYLLHPALTYLLIAIFFTAGFAFSFYKVRDFYIYPNDLIQKAKIISSLTNENDRIVTDRNGDTTLLYLANRRGSPAIYKTPAEFSAMGYKYLITANQESVANLKAEGYQVVVETNMFTLISL